MFQTYEHSAAMANFYIYFFYKVQMLLNQIIQSAKRFSGLLVGRKQ